MYENVRNYCCNYNHQLLHFFHSVLFQRANEKHSRNCNYWQNEFCFLYFSCFRVIIIKHIFTYL